MTLLNIAAFKPSTEVEGPGKRFTLWVQGCLKRCPGCCNEQMLPLVKNQIVTVDEVIEKIVKAKEVYGIEGITLLGGEPFLQAKGLYEVAKACRDHSLTVMVFSGYTIKELEQHQFEGWKDFFDEIDLLVDGPYIQSRPETKRKWIGSINQKLHFLSNAYQPGIENTTEEEQQKIEITIDKGTAVINGWPILHQVKK